MGWRNGAQDFGRATRALHWAMAALILVQLPLGLWIGRTQPTLGTLWLYGLHKTLGITVLGLAVLRLFWHRLSPVPPPLGPPGPARMAKAGHLALYALMLAVPLVGWIAASATGIDSVVFGRWVLPAISPASEAWADRGFLAHSLLALALAVLVLGHFGAALLRRDGTLRRMLTGRAMRA